MTRKTKIGLIQLKISNNKNFNLKNSIKKIREAKKKGAKIICVPELFLSNYFCKTENHSNFKLAERIPSDTSKIFCELARELKIILIISLFEKKISGMYHNTNLTINEKGKIVSKYRKMHIPDEKKIMSYSMLLNLVETSNTNSKDVLWKFVERYAKDLNKKDYPIFDKLIEYSITYFNDIAKSNKKYKNPNNEERKALLNLIKMLESSPDNLEPEDIQTNIYTVGKENGYKENLRDWFKLIYEVVFGVENGPRLGFFISFFGVKNTIKLIKEKIN